ncbi:hypothetical protein DCC62_19245 [candidate division KSB1 bacterium]|nr:MAG: hypothetical protein DCC62_19245 [candidate division KSB1 bacterium]
MEFSIIIPVFEEREKIAADIRAACAFLQSNHLAGEIIVVDDGSRDDTAAVAQSVACSPEVRCTIIRYEQNRGKGFAIPPAWPRRAASISCLPIAVCAYRMKTH